MQIEQVVILRNQSDENISINLAVEMKRNVLPGQTFNNREVWTILDEVQDWQSFERFMELEATLRAVC